MELEVGDRYFVKSAQCHGTIRYIGALSVQPQATFVGLELDLPKGRLDGSFRGRRYFECPANHGLLVEKSEFIRKVVGTQAPIRVMSEGQTQAARMALSGSPSMPSMMPQKHLDGIQVEIQKYEKHIAVRVQKAKELRDLMDEETRAAQTKAEVLAKEYGARVRKLEMAALQRQIALEQEIIAQTERELFFHAKLPTSAGEFANLCQLFELSISEHSEFHEALQALASRQERDLAEMTAEKASLEERLRIENETINSHQAELTDLRKRLALCEEELHRLQPELLEIQSLKPRITSDAALIRQSTRKLAFRNRESEVHSLFLERVSKFFPPTFKLAGLLTKILAKAEFWPDAPEHEDFLHFADCALMVFGQTEVASPQLEGALLDVDSGQNCDVSALFSMLQSATEITLHLTLTPHLLRAAAHRAPLKEAGNELKYLASLIGQPIHPILLTRGREEFEKFMLKLRQHLRQVETGGAFTADEYEPQIHDFLAVIKKTAELKFPVRLPNVKKLEKPVSVTNAGLPEILSLRRKVADTQAIVDQYIRWNRALEQQQATLDAKIAEALVTIDSGHPHRQ
jgi:hypothetical protein